jgi:MoaA/NifB/PqqE/SkfB family radical SAM enzyme
MNLALTAENYRRLALGALTRRVPVYAHFGITHRCNLTCKMCGIWRYGNEKEELSLPQIQDMAAKMRRLGVVQVAIGGGEPFATSHVEEAAKAFIDEGLMLRLLTNGIGVGLDRLDKAMDMGVMNFSISLDSLYPARFDYVCEHDGSWDEAVRSITHIGQRLAGKAGALPTLNCVVSNLNLEELPDMVRFAKDVGFAISFLPVELLETSTSGQRNWEARFIRYRPEMGLHSQDTAAAVLARVDTAYDQIIQMKKDGWPVLNSTPYLQASREYLKTGRFPSEGCDAGSLYFSIAPNGQFTICHRTVQQHKHFLDEDFEDYFKSAVYERSRLVEAGSCEGCMRACWIDTSAMFRTVQGFMETAKLSLMSRPNTVLDLDGAMAWARREHISIVPEQRSAK